MAKIFDVAMIGAGPAGGSAALHCQKNGLNSIVLEDHAIVGEPVHCGECISDLCLKKFDFNVPAKAIAFKAKGVRVVFPDRTESKLTEPGFVLEKHLWEQWIAEQAVKEGAKLELNSRVTNLSRSNEVWKIECGQKSFQSKVLIDASGVQSFASSRLGLNEKRFESVIGIQYEMLDIKTDGYLDFYIWPKLAQAGYLWMIPKNNGRANIGLVTGQKNKAKSFLDEFVKEPEFAGKKIVKTFGGLIPSSGPLPKTFSDGLMLAGDAAGFTSPLFEGGSHLGLMSGKLAADIALKAIKNEDYSKEMMAQYEKLWKNEFPPYEKIIKGRNALYEYSETDLNKIAKMLPKELSNIGLLEKTVIGLKILARNPKMFNTKLIATMQAFGYSQAKYYGW